MPGSDGGGDSSGDGLFHVTGTIDGSINPAVAGAILPAAVSSTQPNKIAVYVLDSIVPVDTNPDSQDDEAQALIDAYVKNVPINADGSFDVVIDDQNAIFLLIAFNDEGTYKRIDSVIGIDCGSGDSLQIVDASYFGSGGIDMGSMSYDENWKSPFRQISFRSGVRQYNSLLHSTIWRKSTMPSNCSRIWSAPTPGS